MDNQQEQVLDSSREQKQQTSLYSVLRGKYNTDRLFKKEFYL